MKEERDGLASINQNLHSIIDRYRDPQGKVNYFSLMADKSMVRFAESLANFDLDSLTTSDEKLAFWINSYNALSIYGVVKKLKRNPEFAKRGNKSWFDRVRFFALQKFTVGGIEISLREIENNIRHDFGDPRIHFALNCSSLGCPLLKDGLYSPENLDKELDASTKLYLRSKEGLQLDIDEDILYVSKVFKWYKNDFESTGRTVLEFIESYAPDEVRTYLEKNKNKVKVKYIDYDWSLNLSDSEES